MKQITSLNQIKNQPSKIYVRWSKSIALDKQRGYSLRYGLQREVGLSCCEIDPTWPDWRTLRQIDEYSYYGGHCWIITGDEVGIGGDNEPLLDNVQLVGKVSQALLSQNWHKMEITEEIADNQDRLTRITDRFAIEIISKSLAKLTAELSKL